MYSIRDPSVPCSGGRRPYKREVISMKYNCGDIVEHEKYGSGLVKQRWLSASGVNELYGGLFIKGLSTDGVKRVIGSELSLVRSVSPGSKLP